MSDVAFFFRQFATFFKNTQFEASKWRLIVSESSLVWWMKDFLFLLTEDKQISSTTKEKCAEQTCASLW